VDWNELDRVSAGIINPDSPQLASYAVLSHTYLHMMVRFGYHFSVIDTLCGPEARQNYIKFRFKGGGGRPEQRILRLQFIERVLSRFGFFVSMRGDLLDARHPAEEDSEIQKRLAMLGLLLARTRMMDMGLTRYEQIDEAEQAFLQDLEALEKRE
jgi:pyruvate,water dikinase